MNIFGIYLSLFTGLAFFLPLPVLGVSVHISLAFSSTMLKWRSKAFTRASSFRLFLQLMSTCVLYLTACVSTDRGPVSNSSSSFLRRSSSDISLLGLLRQLGTRSRSLAISATHAYVSESTDTNPMLPCAQRSK